MTADAVKLIPEPRSRRQLGDEGRWYEVLRETLRPPRERFLDAGRDRYDDEHSSLDEDRWVTIGRSRQTILVVVHTFDVHMRQVTVRIISARAATPNERRQYEGAV